MGTHRNHLCVAEVSEWRIKFDDLPRNAQVYLKAIADIQKIIGGNVLRVCPGGVTAQLPGTRPILNDATASRVVPSLSPVVRKPTTEVSGCILYQLAVEIRVRHPHTLESTPMTAHQQMKDSLRRLHLGGKCALYKLYANASNGECPIQIDTSTPSCGNSRFGCWTCTVVERDKASEGLLALWSETIWN